MPQMNKASADEVLSKRQSHIRSGNIMAKAFKAPSSWNKDTRSARFVMSSQQTDRYGDIVMVAGARTDDFEKNPVALMHHMSREWPVGDWANLEKRVNGRPPRLEGDLMFHPDDAPGDLGERIQEAVYMVSKGFIRACSIGFIPNYDEVEYILDEEGKPTYGYRFNDWELIECSICCIPANAAALVKSAGEDHRLAQELVEDTLDNWARSPEGLLLSRKDFEDQYQIVKKARTPAPAPAPKDGEKPAAWPVLNALPVEEVDLTKVPLDKMNEFRALAAAEGRDAADAALAAFVKSVSEPAEESAPPAPVEESAEEPKDGDEVAEAPPKDDAKALVDAVERELDKAGNAVAISLELDTKEAVEKITHVGGLMDGLIAKFNQIFGKSPKSEVRVEPVLTEEKAETPASPEAVAASKARAAAALERLASKHLV
jgi:phage head maturation protease